MLKPYDILFDMLWQFCLLAFLCEAIISFGGIFFSGIYNSFNQEGIIPLIALIIYVLFILIICNVFMQKWYNLAFLQEKMFVVNFDKKIFFKTFGLTLIFLIISFLPLVSFAALYYREPNPNWIIELLVFTFYALLAVFPFIFVRFLSCFAYVLRGEKIPSIKHMWQQTSEFSRSILASFLILILVISVIFASAMKIDGIEGDIWRGIVFLLFEALLINIAEIQRVEFFNDKKQDN